MPLRIGSGTRLKILEALGMGKAVVSTTVGAEGLALQDGEEIMIADEPNHFADARNTITHRSCPTQENRKKWKKTG